MDAQSGHLKALLDLESRHDELLDRLAELDRRVEQVLAQYAPSGRPSTGDGEGSLPPVETP
jgi:hypothetical protein